MELLKMAGISALVVLVYMTALFILALIRRDNSIADIAWGPGFVIVTGVTLFINGSFTPRQLIAATMVLVWGVRLAVRIYLRNRGKGEDPRYRKWRETWGKSFFIRSFFQVFMLQGSLLVMNIAPVIVINAQGGEKLGLLDLCGILLWVSGFTFEALADRQLDRFTADPKNRGRIMNRGLWRYSRHPNYFGEVVMWWGLFVLALSVPWGWLAMIGPLTITVLILFVSGIPMTEKLMENNPEFARYKQGTSIFIPWFPKSG